MRYFTHYTSPVGELLLASDGENLTGLWLDGQKYYAAGLNADAAQSDSLPTFQQTKRWLDDYFAGKNPDPTVIPLAPQGSEYRRRIWGLLCEVPYGDITAYGKLAFDYNRKYNCATSPRAVGGAVGHNPISIIIPCHRVIGANDLLTGYAGGIDAKRFLLELEEKASAVTIR